MSKRTCSVSRTATRVSSTGLSIGLRASTRPSGRSATTRQSHRCGRRRSSRRACRVTTTSGGKRGERNRTPVGADREVHRLRCMSLASECGPIAQGISRPRMWPPSRRARLCGAHPLPTATASRPCGPRVCPTYRHSRGECSARARTRNPSPIRAHEPANGWHLMPQRGTCKG